MAIQLFGFASTPVDNGTNTASPTAVTPPSGMQKGDLVILWATARTSGVSQSISETGGQTWYALTQRQQTNCCSRAFWCVFNGTWSANPSVTMGGTACNTVTMLVFRGDYGTNTQWQIDVEGGGIYSAPASPYTVTINGITTTSNNELVVALWSSSDDNTWGSLTSGWTALSPAQVRNTSGSDNSATHAWKIQATAGATGNVSQNQLTYGGDAGCIEIAAWKQIEAHSGFGSISVSHSISGTGFKTELEQHSGSGLISITSAVNGETKKGGKGSGILSQITAFAVAGFIALSGAANLSATAFTSATASKSIQSNVQISSESSTSAAAIKSARVSPQISPESSILATGIKTAWTSPQISSSHAISSAGIKGSRDSSFIEITSSIFAAGNKTARASPQVSCSHIELVSGVKGSSGSSELYQESSAEAAGYKQDQGENRYGQGEISASASLATEGQKSASNEALISSICTFSRLGKKNALGFSNIDVTSVAEATGGVPGELYFNSRFYLGISLYSKFYIEFYFETKFNMGLYFKSQFEGGKNE